MQRVIAVLIATLVVCGSSWAVRGYYDQTNGGANQQATHDAWLDRHYAGHPVETSSASGSPSPGQAKQQEDAVHDAWLDRYYSGHPVDTVAMLGPPKETAAKAPPRKAGEQAKAVPATPSAPVNAPRQEPAPTAAVPDGEGVQSTALEDKRRSKKSPVVAGRISRKGNLPPAMDKGVDDMQEGISELRGYTADVAENVKEQGLRGFLDVSPQQKQKGRDIGEKIGEGIRGVMSEVGKEMTTQGSAR